MCDEKKQVETPEVKTLLENVEESRITLVDNKDEEYEFMILGEIENDGRKYLMLVSCDEKTDMGDGVDPGESNDITVVRVEGSEENPVFGAITDADELYAISKKIEEKIGHLNDLTEEV